MYFSMAIYIHIYVHIYVASDLAVQKTEFNEIISQQQNTVQVEHINILSKLNKYNHIQKRSG